jgi:hypothetical protein
MEKPPSPTTELANQRLKRSFEKVKAQVDVDLLQYSKETKLLLHQDGGTEQQQHGVLARCCPMYSSLVRSTVTSKMLLEHFSD